MPHIFQYLDPRLVLFLDAHTREDALKALINHLDAYGLLLDKQIFFEAVLGRERLVSTGIGMGVAIPHAKMFAYDHFFIVVGVLKNGVDWNALDGALVRMIFLIGGPDDMQNQYLQILSKLTFALKDEERRKKMLQFQSPEDIISLFKNV